LPEKLEMALLLLERGHALRNPGTMPRRDLPEILADFLERLDGAKVEWVLVGAEAINLFLARPRATVDVDLIVRTKHLRRVKRILEEACEDLKETEVHFKGVLSREPYRLEVDVIKSGAHELFGIALDRRIMVGTVAVPQIEALLALKYLSVVSPWRKREDKFQDASDFTRAYKENCATIDRALLVDLASRAHEQAGEQFEKFLQAVERDEPITL